MGKAWHLSTLGFSFGSAAVWLCGCVAVAEGETTFPGLSVLPLYSKGWEATGSGLPLALRDQEPVPFSERRHHHPSLLLLVEEAPSLGERDRPDLGAAFLPDSSWLSEMRTTSPRSGFTWFTWLTWPSSVAQAQQGICRRSRGHPFPAGL